MDDATPYQTAGRPERALQAAGAGLFDGDLRTGQIVFSDRQYQMFGLELGTPLTHSSVRECIHPDDRAPVEAAVNQAIARWQAG